MWINRDISGILRANQDPIQIVRGPRQCGKSSLLLHLDPSFKEVSLDDPDIRDLAERDPHLFLKEFGAPKLFIDEAQYAPKIFPLLKRQVDLWKRDNIEEHTFIRLTGSNQILMDRHVKESLAGRASFFDLNTLSVSEVLAFREQRIQDILYKGGWPELYTNEKKEVKKYLDDYISSYIEKDIVLSAGIQKRHEFLKFTKLLAGRIGELIDYASFSKDVGVDSKTIKDWISVLETMRVIALVEPFRSNLSSRLIKSPKVYFVDTGLACRLQGWSSAEPILTSPQQGRLFENLVFSEIYKLNINFQLGWQIYHWRSKDQEEIDFLIQKSPQDFLFVEAKVTAPPKFEILSHHEVKKVFRTRVPHAIVCHQEGVRILDNRVPIAKLSEFLLSNR
ncbi:MAG: hypothetical protein COT74_04505 [Bdellovibrionales bacterium CG10_big_fil_rev_8_21_14_0_10_45_34]|nr:MAG: hypothetical protein COT74_04505 [Bdellovibrionales bacterium CG10_big_fil_rev_8_21_14_0_10_45_34]